MGLNDFFSGALSVLGSKVVGSGEYRGDCWIQVNADHWLPVIDELRAAPFLFEDLTDLCGVDYLGRSPRFEVVVHLYSRQQKARIRIRCLVPDDSLTVPSITTRWPGANWHEREAFDQYGIRFGGHPNLERILNAPDLVAFPQRKDFPLKGWREKKEDL